MATQIPQIYIDQFSKDLVAVSQQKKSRLFMCIAGGNKYDVKAENFSHDFIGPAADMVENTDYFGDSVLTNTPFYRRWGLTTPFEWGEMVSKNEVNRIGRDPKSKILQAASMSRGRKVDDVIISALNAATVLEGPKQGAASAIAFPAGQKIDVDLGSTDGLTPINLTIAKIRKANLILNQNEVDPDLKRYITVTSEELDFLAEGVDIKSSDYKEIMNIINNTSKDQIYWMGLYWIVTERLPVDTLIRTCYVFTEESLVFGQQGDVDVDTDKRSDKKFNWYTQVTQDIGAFRAEDVQTVWIDVATAAADNTFG